MNERLERYLDQIEELIATYGGATVDTALLALRIDAAANLLFGLAFLLGAAGLIALVVHQYRQGARAEAAGEEHWTRSKSTYTGRVTVSEAAFFAAVPASTVTALLTFLAAAHLFNLWHWAGVFHPELYAVYKMVL